MQPIHYKLNLPTDTEIIDRVGELHQGDKLTITCKTVGQWHNMKQVIKAEYPQTYFYITQVNDDGNLILTVKVL